MQIVSPDEIKKILSSTGMPADVNLYATPHFVWQELLVHQTEVPALGILQNLKKVAEVLELYKMKLFNGQPVTITSGWRSEIYNHNIGGAPKSCHTLGLALDFTVRGFEIPELFELMDKYHFGGVEKTNGNWQHIDLRTVNVRFDNKNCILISHYSQTAHNSIFHPGENNGKK